MKIMVDNSREVRKQIFDVLGGLAAVVTLFAYIVLIINANWTFIPENATFVMSVLQVIKTWGALAVCAITVGEYVSDKNIVVRCIFYGLIALVVISMFFPDTMTKFVGIVNEKISQFAQQTSTDGATTVAY